MRDAYGTQSKYASHRAHLCFLVLYEQQIVVGEHFGFAALHREAGVHQALVAEVFDVFSDLLDGLDELLEELPGQEEDGALLGRGDVRGGGFLVEERDLAEDLPGPEAALDAELRRKLAELQTENTPERLVELARELQKLLRDREADSSD